jgi:MFS family permease
MAAVTLGTLVLQYPVGQLSDRFDRRIVILGVAIVSGLSVLVATLLDANNLALLLICMLIFGGTNFPLYSLCIAHANDYLTPRQMVAMASGLIMINGAGAVIGAPIAAMFIEYLGTISFMPAIATLQFLLALFVLVRMRSRSAVPAAAQGPYVAIPDSSSGVAASLNPETEWVTTDEDGFADDDPLKDNPYMK